MESKIKKQALTYGIAAVLLALILGTMIYNAGIIPYQPPIPTPPVPATHSSLLSAFASEEDIKNFLKSNSIAQGPYSIYSPADATNINTFLRSTPEAQSATLDINSEGSSYAYSTTNIQVSGVDESDTVKTEDGYIYVLSGNALYILKAYPPTLAEVISKTVFDDLYPIGIFVKGDRLTVLGSTYRFPTVFEGYYITDTNTTIRVYNIHDKSHPQLLQDLTLTGSYFNSRMIGNYVYFVISKPAYVFNDTIYLPEIETGNQITKIAPSEIRYCNGTDNRHQYTTFVAMNMQNTTEAPVYLTIMLGSTGNMYVSLTNMYVTFRDWNWNGNTTIYRIRLQASNMTCEAKGQVPGHEGNQFSMDEYNDYFRIQTATSVDWTTRTNVYVLDMNLSIVGRLENLAPGEDSHAARFMGKRAYLVTFKSVDPLFVIDLSDPANPAVLGELKIPGYSDYLHPYDETHLIGVGKETVASDQEYFAWYQGIKVSLFDVSNVTNPTQIANITIGHRGSESPVLNDHKAFLFDRSKNLLSIPVEVAEIDETLYANWEVPSSARGTPVWQGACVYDVSLEHGFTSRGNITHLETGMSIHETGYHVKRSLYIEDVFYTVSDRKVKLNALEDLAPIAEIPLP